MTQREYNLRKKSMNRQRYGERQNRSSINRGRDTLSYQGGRFAGEEEEYLPYGIFFRVRLALCLVLLLFFIYAEKNYFTEEEKTEVYQAMEQNVSAENWRSYMEHMVLSLKNLVN